VINRLFTWLESATDPFPTHLPQKPPQTLLRFIYHYARPFKGLIAISAVLAVSASILEVFLFAFVGDLVDWLTTTDRSTLWEEHGLVLIGMGLLAAVAIPILKFFFESVVHAGLLGNFAMRTRWQAHRYLLRQSMTFFQDDFAGRVATKMMQTALAVRDVLISAIQVFLYVGVYFTAAVVLFAASDLRLTAPMILWLLGYIVTLRHFVPRLRDISMQQADFRSIVTGRVVDSYSNISTVKMFAEPGYEDSYAREGMLAFLQNVYQQMRLSTKLICTIYILNGLLLVSTAGIGIWLWQQTLVTTGAIAFALGLVLRMHGMSQWIMWEIWRLFEEIGVVQDGIETISRDRLVIDKDDAPDLEVENGAIRYDAITFNYNRGSEDDATSIIEDLSLDIKPGERIGLVGRSGAGKSTMVSLLLRFYDLEVGKIEIDGQDIAEVTQKSLRSKIGMVTQDSSLLHRSVIDNIRYGRPEASIDEVIAAAKKAHAHDFILDLEDNKGRKGYDAHVGERGVKLSGGQRQRIAIARVLLKDAPILILDEATSALDSEVEAAIQENLYHLMEGKTVIAIAHRLSTIAAMDRLVIMDHGKIIEEGNHKDLLDKGGLYADLWARQSGGFVAGEDEAAE